MQVKEDDDWDMHWCNVGWVKEVAILPVSISPMIIVVFAQVYIVVLPSNIGCIM